MTQTTATPSMKQHLISHEEPFLLCNFDFNPHTSVFGLTFLAATLFQISGFYIFRRLIPELAIRKRRLSWILSFFSSIVLFTGTFTLSTEMEWMRYHFAGDVSRTARLEVNETKAWRWQPPLSLRAYPIESSLATMYSAYFVSYLICDLVLGMIHYRSYIDPLSGWCHHLVYFAVVSSAATQKNLSTFFAMGAPIEVSTIVLASGHIFPQLRSDYLFAISFFLSRIVYPVVLLPELFLNVDARLCWKVGLMALMVHVHWFKKFVQQQLRYSRARVPENVRLPATHNVQTELPQHQKIANTVITTANEHLHTPQGLPEPNLMTKPKVNISEYSLTIKTTKSYKAPSVSTGQNITVETLQQPQEQTNIMRGVQTPRSNHGSAKSKPAQVVTARRSCARPSLPDTMMEATSPTKTMIQLLEECAGEDEETFMRNCPILPRDMSRGNKTFSAVVLKRLRSSQGKVYPGLFHDEVERDSAVAFGGREGVGASAGISRASSVRDSKRRIGLNSVLFEEPATCMTRERKDSQRPQAQHQHGSTGLRSRRTLTSEDNMDETNDSQVNREFDFETIRISRRAVVAVNA